MICIPHLCNVYNCELVYICELIVVSLLVCLHIYYPIVFVFRLYVCAWQDDIDVWHNDIDIMTWHDDIDMTVWHDKSTWIREMFWRN